jgi:hypothetical protein
VASGSPAKKSKEDDTRPAAPGNIISFDSDIARGEINIDAAAITLPQVTIDPPHYVSADAAVIAGSTKKTRAAKKRPVAMTSPSQ